MAQTVEAKQVVLKDSEGGYLLPYAGVAQKALKDNDGNDIPTTYAKRADLNGYLPVDGKAVDSAKADTATSAASATKATQDSAGQQINTTYIKNVSVNGRTITFTRGDGTTFTITTQDTVTTNSSNWSVSNGTNGWARDNSTGFTIVWGKVNGTISQNPSANFARSLNVVHSAVISKGSYLGEAYATNINWISNSAISVAGYKLGNGSVNYAVFGFS
ncbi:hypothetical protein [Parasutterella excrementihominis]|uniref:hypothetical protein n=4 Tax=Sutterellaceae TaxID=995019 RepID=UPI003AF4A25F